jgi:MSHA biogenesis protein MshN
LAENEYRKATALLNQGRMAEAQEGFEAALNLYPGDLAARQALVGVFVETKKLADAERVLQDGLALAPAQIGFAMALARLQIDRGDAAQAVATMRKSYDYAQGNADYVAFFAALLQRQGRHEEAIEQFQAALRARPTAGVWWLGLGISLQATSRATEAQEAFRRARATNNLSPELAAFADQRIKQLH